jgi:very-short-patch-repair endonuclease
MHEEGRVTVVERPQHDLPHPDRVIQRLADTHHGVVCRRQLAAAGITGAMLKARVASGHLLRLHRGIYAVGHTRLRREGWWLAAVLACGPRAALSHRDAAALHGIRPCSRAKVDVTVLGPRSQRPQIDLHRTTVLEPPDLTVVDGIPVTSVARTLVDLAGVVRPASLAKALSEAERMNLLDLRALRAAKARTQGRRGPGHARLAQALAELEAQGTTLTRSPLEVAFLGLASAAGLPRPRTNVHVEGFEVDVYWPDHRLVVELDGWEFHRSRDAFQRDRAKTTQLTLAGYVVLRFTHDDVLRRPQTVVDGVRRAVAAPSGRRATMMGPCP